MLLIHVVAPNDEKPLHLVRDLPPGVCEQFMANMSGSPAHPVDDVPARSHA